MSDDVTRLRRVVDMMLTMHAVLRDRYVFRAVLLDVLILVVSVFLCALTFAEPRVLGYANITADTAKDFLAGIGVALFALSITALRVDWKQVGSKHGRACEILSRLKAELRGVTPESSAVITERVNRALEDVPPIPEGSFLALKARHLRKIEISRALSANPGSPLLVVSLSILLRSGLRAARGESNGASSENS